MAPQLPYPFSQEQVVVVVDVQIHQISDHSCGSIRAEFVLGNQSSKDMEHLDGYEVWCMEYRSGLADQCGCALAAFGPE